MSLINEALKKAQHQRTSSASDAPPMPGGAGSGAGRSSGIPTQLLVLLIAGAVAVVVISVVATVYFVNRAPAAKVTSAPVAATPVLVQPTVAAPKPAPAPAPSPVIIAPIIVQALPPPAEIPTPPPTVVEAETHPAAAVTPVAEPVVEDSLADRIATYVEKARVTGIRTSDSGSKVLMNDKVYRLNDIVDRKLGLRLVKIAQDSLTFADANGATYVKTF